MSDLNSEMQNIPTSPLTLDGSAAVSPAAPVAAETAPAADPFAAVPNPFATATPAAKDDAPKAEKVDLSAFSEEEQKQILAFADQIDLGDTKTIISYGSGVQKQMGDFSETVLQSVRTSDLGEVGDMLSSVVVELKHFDADDKDKGGFLGFFKKQSRKAEELKADYDKAAVNVDKVTKALQMHQVKLLKDVDMLDKMYAANLQYYKQLSMYIAAGKQKIYKMKTEDVPAAKAKAAASGLAEDAQAARDLEDQVNRFEKKIYDLELTRQVSLQTAPQIRMIQNNDTTMVEKIQSTIVNTIPLWKNQMVLALGLNDSMQAAKAQNDVTNMTNQLLTQNAEKLKQTTVETAKASERGIVDMETLKHTNEQLISTFDEVTRIQEEGRTKRAQAEADLQAMEKELKEKLLAMQK